MIQLDWSDQLSVGVAYIDAEHRALIGAVNRLIGAITRGETAQLAPILADVLNQTRQHFADEERLMRACAYPGLAAHQAEHRALLDELVALSGRVETQATAVPATEFVAVLSKWLMRHIITSDRDYRPYLVGHPALAGKG